MHAGMQSFYTTIEHFRRCCETRYLAHRNLFFPQQDRCSACGNDVYALAFQRASKCSDAGFVRNGNESAANFHPKKRNFTSFRAKSRLQRSRRRRRGQAFHFDAEGLDSATGSLDTVALRSE